MKIGLIDVDGHAKKKKWDAPYMPMHNLTVTLSEKRMKYRCGRRIWLDGVTNE